MRATTHPVSAPRSCWANRRPPVNRRTRRATNGALRLNRPGSPQEPTDAAHATPPLLLATPAAREPPPWRGHGNDMRPLGKAWPAGATSEAAPSASNSAATFIAANAALVAAPMTASSEVRRETVARTSAAKSQATEEARRADRRQSTSDPPHNEDVEAVRDIGRLRGGLAVDPGTTRKASDNAEMPLGAMATTLPLWPEFTLPLTTSRSPPRLS
mmetsp:Transcript_133712/g.387113  ORF Transcript_133712/g.387113 Transcript_133712/m.387113 type:complete len:215 (+) Transcript_133712:213-857(+)